MLHGGSFCKRAECEAPRRMPCAEMEYIFLFASICFRYAQTRKSNEASLCLHKRASADCSSAARFVNERSAKHQGECLAPEWSIYFSLHSKFDICSLCSHSICCLRQRWSLCDLPRATHNVTSLALPFWQRISSALALYRVLYISSATRYAKHIERRVRDASRRSAPAEPTPRSALRNMYSQAR